MRIEPNHVSCTLCAIPTAFTISCYFVLFCFVWYRWYIANTRCINNTYEAWAYGFIRTTTTASNTWFVSFPSNKGARIITLRPYHRHSLLTHTAEAQVCVLVFRLLLLATRVSVAFEYSTDIHWVRARAPYEWCQSLNENVCSQFCQMSNICRIAFQFITDICRN